MSVVVDTSVWVDHFRRPDRKLWDLLQKKAVLTHHVVLGEIACGTPPSPRSRAISFFRKLPKCVQAAPEDVLDLIERERLYGQGCGLSDITLLASTVVTPGARLWTLDRSLGRLACRLGVALPQEASD